MIYSQLCDTPIGNLCLVSNGAGITHIEFEGKHTHTPDEGSRGNELLNECAQQLREYFAGQRSAFDLPLAPQGTDFQQEVWSALRRIPFGELRSYRDIALVIGRERAVRAVGAANGRNPIPIIMPCHRVIGADGSLTGFAGGLAAKEALLRLEGALTA